MHRESHITRLKPVAFGSTSLASNGHWTPQQQRGSYVSVVSSSRQCSLVNPTVGAERLLQLRAVAPSFDISLREHLATSFITRATEAGSNGRHDAFLLALCHDLLAARVVAPIVPLRL